VVVKVFLTSTTVTLNHFAEGSQIYDLVSESHKKFATSQLTRFVLLD